MLGRTACGVSLKRSDSDHHLLRPVPEKGRGGKGRAAGVCRLRSSSQAISTKYELFPLVCQ